MKEVINGQGNIYPCSRRSFYEPTKIDEAIGFRITLYLKVEENWSEPYDKEGIYKDKNGDIASIPQGFRVSKQKGENTIAEGLVVKDSKDNEWVWIEVPKLEEVYQTAGLKIENFTEEEYTKIENDLQTYASAYREEEYTDTFYATEQHGFEDAKAYNDHKKTMLKSVYQNGGFYIGRYEAGRETARYNRSDDLTEVVVKRDKYPYNLITCTQAQTKSKELATGGKTSSLMFGIQWDLVLKYMEEKGSELGKTKEERQKKLKTDSTDWGNYTNAEFLVTRGKYTIAPTTFDSWTEVVASYAKPTTSVLLTTGATERNNVLGIYDFAGNVWEWTLEHTLTSNGPCGRRGGVFINDGIVYPVFYRYGLSTSYADYDVAFRPALW